MFRYILGLTLSMSLSNCAKMHSNSDTDDFTYPGALDSKSEEQNQWNLVYKYQGPMPQFKETEIFISYDGRTLRIEGEPVDSEGQSVAIREIEKLKTSSGLDYLYRLNDTKRFYVVYPIAVGKNSRGELLKQSCRKCTFEGEGNYKFVRINPRRKFQAPSKFFDTHSWHLMPYIGYGKGTTYGSYALHSPITSATVNIGRKQVKMLHLRRGAVSGGCKRMAPEHIIEISHILGINTDVELETNYRTNDGVNFPEILQQLNSLGMNAKSALLASKNPDNFRCREEMHAGQTDCFIHVMKKVETIELLNKIIAEVDVTYPSWKVRPSYKRDQNYLLVHKTWSMGDNKDRRNWICYYKFRDPKKSCRNFTEDQVAKFDARSKTEIRQYRPGLYAPGEAVDILGEDEGREVIRLTPILTDSEGYL